MPNGILPVELLLAAARLGAVTIGLNTRYRVEDLRHLVERGRPRVLVAVTDFLDIDFPAVVGAALAGLDRPPRLLWPDDVAALRTGHEPIVTDRAHPSDLAVAFTTSGTTGRPKLAAHDHASTVRHLGAAARSLQVTPDSTGLLILPFCGTFGFVSLLAVLAGGGRVVVPDHFDPSVAATLMERHGVTHVNGSDDMLLAVLGHAAGLTRWHHGVQAEFTGQGDKAVEQAEAAGARITGAYGSSETFALLARWSPEAPVGPRARAGGIPVDPAMEVRAIDAVTGRVLAPGDAGELQLRGPSVLSAYLAPDGTSPPSTTPDGWFATGDLGAVDGEGGFVYLSRLGDALRLAGFLTDPAEIEQHLLTHPAVSGVQVVGAPRPGGGEMAVAFVVARGEVDEAALIDHCTCGLANYKVPARIVMLESFPTVDGANGVKIRKAELRQRAIDLTVDATGRSKV